VGPRARREIPLPSSPAYAQFPQHRVEIDPEPATVRILFDGHVVAESNRARILRESRCPPVAYLPREDVQMEWLERTDHTTHCRFKGDAAYYSVRVGESVSDNAVWTYEEPYDEVAPIAGHLAFYADRFTIEGLD
jgi:uncharacterized protein (DUF427 family)